LIFEHSVGRLFRFVLLAGALFSCTLVAGGGAQAAVPVAPPDGATVSGTPTLAWGPGPGEEANQIELSPDRTPADDGSFVDDPRKRKVLLDPAQTAYTVPPEEALPAGSWFWHVEMIGFDFDPCCSRWTEARRIVVADEPIKLSSFKLGFLRGIDQFVLRIAYSDNSVDLAARYRLVFKRHRHGRRLGRLTGRLDKGSFQKGGAFASGKRPKRLRRGRRYFARLELRDAAGHVARSRYVRIRL
jgi:hypothetical protein